MIKKVFIGLVILFILPTLIYEVYLRYPRTVNFEEVGRVEMIGNKPDLELRLLSNKKMRDDFIEYRSEFQEIFDSIHMDYSIAISFSGKIEV